MNDPLLFLFLVVLSLCAIAGTVALCVTAADLRRMSREAQRMFSAGRLFLDRANRTAAHLQRIVEKSCDVAEDALEELNLFRRKTRAFWTRYLGNGIKPRSDRLHHRNDP